MDHLSSAGRQPEFVRVVPAEVAKYGSNAAIVLAHIRFRCDGDGWWRVSLSDFGREVGLSVKAVRTALAVLANVVEATHLSHGEDRTLAYRLAGRQAADQPFAAEGTWSQAADQPFAAEGTTICPTGHDHLPPGANALLIENLEKGGEENPAPPTCPRHPNGPDHDEKCRACMRWRKWLEAHHLTDDEEYRRKRREARAIQDNCKICGGDGWDGSERCECTMALRRLRR
jgi:hypothetical protein